MSDNGTVGWAIKWVANAGVEYTVKDFDTTLGTSVRCATTDTWDPATTKVIDATRIDSNTVKFAAPEGSKVCITYPPEQMRVPDGQSSVTNHAEVNGLKLEATATIRSNGGTDGDGSMKPTPTPAPNPSTEPSEPTPTPSDEPTPTPTQTPCTIHPDRDKDRVPCKIEYIPAPTKATPKPAPTIEAPKAKLAKTGAASEATVISILSLLFGAAIVAVAWFVGRYGTTR